MLVEREQIHYITMSEGKMTDKRAGLSTNAILGVFIGCTWYFDPGKPNLKPGPRDRIEITLSDGSGTYIVQTTLGVNGEAVTGGWMLASYLLGVSPGEEIQVSCKSGGENTQVCTGFIEVRAGDGWRMADRAQYPADPVGRLTLARHDIENHAGWYKPRPKKDGPSTADTVDKCPQEREFWAETLGLGWPSPVTAREAYVAFFSRELKRTVADFEDISPRQWGELASVVRLIGPTPAKWPSAFRPQEQARDFNQALEQTFGEPAQNSDPEGVPPEEYDPFSDEDAEAPVAAAHEAPDPMLHICGMMIPTSKLSAIARFAAPHGLKAPAMIELAKAEGCGTADEVLSFAIAYTPKPVDTAATLNPGVKW